MVNCSFSVPGGELPKKLGRGVRPASQNPYPIYDLTLSVTSRCGTYTVAVNIICEGLLLLVLSTGVKLGRGKRSADRRRGA